jgi:hypothetical protein
MQQHANDLYCLLTLISHDRHAPVFVSAALLGDLLYPLEMVAGKACPLAEEDHVHP